jgi:hypothetical protein
MGFIHDGSSLDMGRGRGEVQRARKWLVSWLTVQGRGTPSHLAPSVQNPLPEPMNIVGIADVADNADEVLRADHLGQLLDDVGQLCLVDICDGQFHSDPG